MAQIAGNDRVPGRCHSNDYVRRPYLQLGVMAESWLSFYMSLKVFSTSEHKTCFSNCRIWPCVHFLIVAVRDPKLIMRNTVTNMKPTLLMN